MPIEFPCSNCQNTLRTPDGSEGKRVRCPSCETILTVPGQPSGGGETSPPPLTPSDAGGGSNPFHRPDPAPAGGASLADPSSPFNPYAAPSTPRVDDKVAESELGPPGHGTLVVGEVLQTAWESYKADPATYIIVALIQMGISFGVSQALGIIPQLLQASGAKVEVFVSALVIVQVLSMLIQVWLALGLALYMVRKCRTGRAEIKLLFTGGRHLVRGFFAGFLLAMATLVIYCICLAPATILFLQKNQQNAAIAAAIVGGVLAMVGVMTLTLMYAQFTFMITDRGARLMEAFSWSAQVTRGNRLSLLVLYLALLGIYLGTFLACCLPAILVGMPLLNISMALAYLQMCGEPIRVHPANSSPVVQR